MNNNASYFEYKTVLKLIIPSFQILINFQNIYLQKSLLIIVYNTFIK
jgi:hypothetical protein